MFKNLCLLFVAMLSNESGFVATGVSDDTADEGDGSGGDEDRDGSGDTSEEESDSSDSQADDQQDDEDGGNIIDHEGRKFVAQDSVQTRIDQLVKERNEAREAVEKFQSSPDFRDSIVKKLKEEISRDSHRGNDNEPTPTQKWLSSIDKEHSKFYSPLLGALGTEFSAHVEGRLEKFEKEVLAPLFEHMGRTKQESFATKVGQEMWNKYGKETIRYMEKYNVPIEDAFKITAGPLINKGVQDKRNRDEQRRQDKIRNNPISGKRTGDSTKHPVKNINDALRNVAKKINFDEVE